MFSFLWELLLAQVLFYILILEFENPSEDPGSWWDAQFIHDSLCISKTYNHRYLSWLSHKTQTSLDSVGPQNLLSSESMKVSNILILRRTPTHALYIWFPVGSMVLRGSINSRKWSLDGRSRSLVAGPLSMLPIYHELNMGSTTLLRWNYIVNWSRTSFSLFMSGFP